VGINQETKLTKLAITIGERRFAYRQCLMSVDIAYQYSIIYINVRLNKRYLLKKEASHGFFA